MSMKTFTKYVPKKKNPFTALAEPEPVPDLWAYLRADPIYMGMQNGTVSWADTLDEEEETPEQIAAFRIKRREYELLAEEAARARTAIAFRENYDTVVVELNKRRVTAELVQTEFDEREVDKQAWLETQEDYNSQDPDELGMNWESYWSNTYDDWYKHATKDIHRDANGEPEICRFFSSPGGCNLPNGKKCPYKHVAGAAPEPCRFFSTPRGCNKGSSCPFSHVEASWRQPTTVGQRPPSPAEGCRFFKSSRGCNKGSSCQYKH